MSPPSLATISSSCPVADFPLRRLPALRGHRALFADHEGGEGITPCAAGQTACIGICNGFRRSSAKRAPAARRAHPQPLAALRLPAPARPRGVMSANPFLHLFAAPASATLRHLLHRARRRQLRGRSHHDCASSTDRAACSCAMSAQAERRPTAPTPTAPWRTLPASSTKGAMSSASCVASRERACDTRRLGSDRWPHHFRVDPDLGASVRAHAADEAD